MLQWYIILPHQLEREGPTLNNPNNQQYLIVWRRRSDGRIMNEEYQQLAIVMARRMELLTDGEALPHTVTMYCQTSILRGEEITMVLRKNRIPW